MFKVGERKGNGKGKYLKEVRLIGVLFKFGIWVIEVRLFFLV